MYGTIEQEAHSEFDHRTAARNGAEGGAVVRRGVFAKTVVQVVPGALTCLACRYSLNSRSRRIC